MIQPNLYIFHVSIFIIIFNGSLTIYLVQVYEVSILVLVALDVIILTNLLLLGYVISCFDYCHNYFKYSFNITILRH